MTPTDRHCPACGYDVPIDEFVEGYCAECWHDQQRALDEHNARFDWWNSLTDAERADQIRRAYR